MSMPSLRTEDNGARLDNMQGFQAMVRQLVKDASALKAIASGEVDAILDPSSGQVILMPDTNSGLRASEARMRSLLALNSDANWEHDKHGCFTSYIPAGPGNVRIFDGENLIGKTFRALPFDNMSAAGWKAHQDILRQRLAFRDLELTFVDGVGDSRKITISGEPVFDARGKFTGYHGVMQDIAAQRRWESISESVYTGANQLLAALPVEHYQKLRTGLEQVTLTQGQVLHEVHQQIEYVYFPEDATVSLIAQVDAGLGFAVGLVGREGMIGAPLALGSDRSTTRSLVQGTGTAMRMEAKRFGEDFRQCLPLQGELYRFIHLQMTHIMVLAVCNHFHRVDARLARWLLMTRDHSASNDLYLTHEYLAEMLGVRREALTLAAISLLDRKLIHYQRGHIKILNHRALAATACECYKKIKKPL